MAIYTYVHENNETQHSDEAVALVEAAIQSVLNESLADRLSKVGAGLDKVGAKVGAGLNNAGSKIKSSAEYAGNVAKGLAAINKEKKDAKKEYAATHSKPTAADRKIDQKMKADAKANAKRIAAQDAEVQKADDEVAKLEKELADAKAKQKAARDAASML